MNCDTSVAAMRYVLINTATGELGNDEFLTSEVASTANNRLIYQGSPCRLVPWAESEAA